MFTYLKFRMVNSIGTPVSVNLYNNGGRIDYEILFPTLGVTEAKRLNLGKGASEKLLRKIEKSGFLLFVERFARLDATENKGDFWSLDVELSNGLVVEINGPEPQHSVLYPFIQDFSELLDRQFSITRYVRDDRVDKLEIGFCFNELEDEQLVHKETVTMDRSDFTFRYSKRFPASCFHGSFEFKCEQQVRQILDQTSDALSNEKLFEDIYMSSEDYPVLYFNYSFHDGSTVTVRRSLCRDGLRDRLYLEMIDVLYETSLHLLFKNGIFDSRYQLPAEEKEETPFFVAYREGEEGCMVEEVERA